MKYFFWIFLIILLGIRILLFDPGYESGDYIRLSTRVATEPIRYPSSQYLKLEGLRVYLPPFPEIRYGDRVVVEGLVDGNKLMNPKLIERKQAGNRLYQFRDKVIKVYQKSLPEPYVSLVAGMTIGSKASIPDKFWKQLKDTGTAHVVVASGMNVSLVAGFLLAFFILFIRRTWAVAFALIGIWGYALISGFDAPIVRSAVMGSIAFTAQGLGRLNYAWRALFLTIFVMLLVKPAWLNDLGFALSFVATASLMLFSGRIQKFLKAFPKFLREDLSTTLAAQIGVAPILFVTFGSFNILSPLINALVLWTVVPITIIGGLAGVVGVWVPDLGRLMLLIIYPLLFWFVLVIGWFS